MPGRNKPLYEGVSYEVTQPFDLKTKSVGVTFKFKGGSTFTRPVNAVITDGEYNESATISRVDELIPGLAKKKELGLLPLTKAVRKSRKQKEPVSVKTTVFPKDGSPPFVFETTKAVKDSVVKKQPGPTLKVKKVKTVRASTDLRKPPKSKSKNVK